MWIELTDTLPTVYPNASLPVCSVLESLAAASFHGRHVVYGSRRTLNWALSQQLSGPAKAAISRTLSTLSERGSARDFVSSKLVIQPGQGNIYRDANNHFNAPIESLVGIPMQANEILAENLRDAAALTLAASHYKKINKLNSFGLALAPQNGGGAEILACFVATIQARQRFTLATTDSDKDYPTATASAVSRGCARVATEASWVCSHYELPCREIENLLPYNLIEDSIREAQDSIELVDPLNNLTLVVQRHPDALKYADLKEGSKGVLSVGEERNLERRAYWSEVKRNSDIENHICGDSCKTVPCECRITPGLGNRVLQRFLDHCQAISIGKQVERVSTSPQRQDWLDAGKVVFNWGLADHPVRT